MELVRKYALAAGADQAVGSNHWAKGGEGAVDLAKAVISACEEDNDFKYLCKSFSFIRHPLLRLADFDFSWSLDDTENSIENKIETIAKEMYGADGITIEPEAQKQIDTYTAQGTARVSFPS